MRQKKFSMSNINMQLKRQRCIEPLATSNLTSNTKRKSIIIEVNQKEVKTNLEPMVIVFVTSSFQIIKPWLSFKQTYKSVFFSSPSSFQFNLQLFFLGLQQFDFLFHLFDFVNQHLFHPVSKKFKQMHEHWNNQTSRIQQIIFPSLRILLLGQIVFISLSIIRTF